MKKFKDIEEEVKNEVEAELAEDKKAILKEYLLEMQEAKKVYTKIKTQYEKLLEMDLDEYDPCSPDFIKYNEC